ncbi:MAG: c-type cytochrome [Caulobacterales bacterium]
MNRQASIVARVVGLALASSAIMVSGCTTGGGAPLDTRPADVAAAQRGEALAQQACGSCHGLGLTGESHWVSAPAFREMHFDYNAISYQRRMSQLHMRQISMPPEELDLDQVGDIGAYIHSLKRQSHR